MANISKILYLYLSMKLLHMKGIFQYDFLCCNVTISNFIPIEQYYYIYYYFLKDFFISVENMNFESPLVTELTADSQRQPSAPNPWTPYGKPNMIPARLLRSTTKRIAFSYIHCWPVVR